MRCASAPSSERVELVREVRRCSIVGREASFCCGGASEEDATLDVDAIAPKGLALWSPVYRSKLFYISFHISIALLRSISSSYL